MALTITTDACRSHGGKVPHRSREKAWKTIKKMTASGMTGIGLQVYACSGCGLFLLTGQPRRPPQNAGGYCQGMEEAVVPVLYTDDADRAIAWYGHLGFHKQWEVQFEPGFPRFVSVARGRVRLYLSEHKGDARPDTLIHLYVNDIDAVSEEFVVPVDDEGLAGRESALVDPDGNRLRVATRRV